MNLIDYIKKFKSLIDKMKIDLNNELGKELEKKESLQKKIDDGCSKAGEIRGEIKTLIKKSSNDGNIDHDTLVKLQSLKDNLDKHVIEFQEEVLRLEMANIDKNMSDIYASLKIVSE